MERKYLAVPREKDIVRFFRTNHRLPVNKLCDKATDRFNFCPYEILNEPEARERSKVEKGRGYRQGSDYYMIDERTGTTISSSNPDF